MTAHELRRSANGATKEPLADFTGQGTILLVEDEQSLRSLIARGLRSRGYSVIEAAAAAKTRTPNRSANGRAAA
jgi:two-component system cell cycle sensor histidine kinase/response regulator CckA